ncbi:general substrate transporter [Stipitochalara longipes BDJ]|nr:general substrate transporter [Stipitochalara longipes BDJ]
MLNDIIPARHKLWWHYPGLRTLNLLLLCAIVTDITNGYDGSMLNGLQILPEWRNFFGRPTGSRLGSITNGVRYGQLGALFISAPLIQRLGRKKPIAIGSAVLLVGVILQSAAQNYGTFVAGRFLIGFGNTIQTTACPILISELSHPSQRTQMVGIMNSTGSLGQLMAAWITFGTASIVGSWSWRLPSALQAASSLFQMILCIFVPESPRWLVEHNRIPEARRILQKYHAEGDSDFPLLQFEMVEIERTIEEEKIQAVTSWKEWIRTHANRHRLFIVVTAGFIIQWCGNAVLSNYLHLILVNIGIKSNRTQLLINGGISLNGFFWGNFFSLFVDRIGRRPLWLIGMAGMCLSLTVITILGSFQAKEKFSSSLGWSAVAMWFVFGAFYKMPAPMVNSYIAEVAPYNLRAKAFVIFGFGDALSNLFSGYVNPIALAAIGWKYWLVWVFVLVSNFTIIYFFYPETKNLALEEVSRVFDHVPSAESDGGEAGSERHEKSSVDGIEVRNLDMSE